MRERLSTATDGRVRARFIHSHWSMATEDFAFISFVSSARVARERVHISFRHVASCFDIR